MKVFVIFWVVCLCTLSIHSPSAWAVDPAIKNDPLIDYILGLLKVN